MQIVVKYLLNPRCKNSISASTFVEAFTLDKSAPLHDGKTHVISRGRVPLHQIFSFYISLRPCYQYAQKSIQMLFSLVKLAKLQSTAGETKRICCNGPLSMNDKLSADRIEQANKFAKFTVPIYGSSILTRFKPS